VRVIIAGGGTGGLATAIALRKAGIEPLVLEQAPAFTAIGAGLGLYANAMKALSYLGATATGGGPNGTVAPHHRPAEQNA
jgi:salicylate hydroxylase